MRGIRVRVSSGIWVGAKRKSRFSVTNVTISAQLVIRKGWWDSVSGFTMKCSRPYHTVILSSVLQSRMFHIPKILRRYFLCNRSRLSKLSRYGWESLKAFSQEAVPVEDPVLCGEEDALPGAVIAIQTFGDFLGFNPHCYVLCTDGGFYAKGMFRVSPPFVIKNLEEIFRHKVFEMLLSRKKITEDLIHMMMGWWNSGFNVNCGQRIQPGEEEAIENLAR